MTDDSNERKEDEEVEPQEYDQLLRRMAAVIDHMDQAVDELRLMNGRLETRIEQHDQMLARIVARQDNSEATLAQVGTTLARLDRTLDAFLQHLQHPSGNGR